ncbi:MAG: hypothetical protein ACRD3Q_06685 [Terriglobales bacterium]
MKLRLFSLFCVPITIFAALQAATPSTPPHGVRVQRLGKGPIITQSLDPSIGENIQGPSLIRVPDWVQRPLGRYYLYFAAHKGRYIRLAYADKLVGPWRVYVPGTVQIGESHFLTSPPPASEKELANLRAGWKREEWSHDLPTEATTPHIASPDVHVDSAHRRIIMYFHGLEALGHQVTRVAVSSDGIRFKVFPDIVIPLTYVHTFDYDGYTYAMAMPGQFYRSHDALKNFEVGPRGFNRNMRHAALLRRGNTLYVFWTKIGAAPEGILVSTVDLSSDWMKWKESAPVEVLRPERDWEGSDAPVKPSLRSTAYGHVNQLRDPAIFEENGRVYLLYAVAGESGIAMAAVHLGQQ